MLGGAAVDLAIRHEAGALVVESDRSLRAHERELTRKLTRMFQLGVDTGEFFDLASASATHAWVADSGFGRLLCGSTPFEDAVKIIATTNTTWVQTMRMVELIVERCGTPSRRGRKAFPEPAAIAALGPALLQNDCRLGYRAKTIHALALGVAEGSLDLGALADPDLTAKEQLARYRTLPGIGPYGAAHLMAMDGRHDFIAVDTEFRRFVRERYHRGRAVSDATLLRRYRRWGRWQYLAYWAELWENAAPALVKYESAPE
ncbi:MAG TPA: endonuclease III domain-containing protein [Thermoanaerobaculia bacterium]